MAPSTVVGRPPRGGLTGVCNGFLRRGMASNLQVGLGFRPGVKGGGKLGRWGGEQHIA